MEMNCFILPLPEGGRGAEDNEKQTPLSNGHSLGLVPREASAGGLVQGVRGDGGVLLR